MPEISLVVPVFDEEDNLRDLHQAITDALTGMSYEVLYVNDGSVDRSAAVLDELARADSRARVIHFVRNYGQTAALTAGIRNARAPILVTLDADMQNDPADIPRMIDMLDEGCDVVCGWRKDRKDNTLTRTLPSKAANWLISRLSNVPLHDRPGCHRARSARAAAVPPQDREGCGSLGHRGDGSGPASRGRRRALDHRRCGWW